MASGVENDVRAYWEGRLSERFSLAGVGYLGLGEGFNKWMYRVRRRLFARRICPLVAGREPLEVLDIGSGTGFYVERWREAGATRIVGSDITSTVVDELHVRFPDHEFVRTDVGEADSGLPDHTFDAVSAFDVLYHLIDDDRYRRAFFNVARRVKPGGIFCFTENFLHGPAVRTPTQVSRSLNDIERLVDEAGFDVVSRTPVAVLMNGPIDSDSRALHRWWKLLSRAAGLHERVGWALGAALYPLELALAARLSEGPSNELMICRRR